MSTTETKPRQILIHYDRAQLSLGDAATTDDASAWLANLAGLLAQEFGARVSLASVGTWGGRSVCCRDEDVEARLREIMAGDEWISLLPPVPPVAKAPTLSDPLPVRVETRGDWGVAMVWPESGGVRGRLAGAQRLIVASEIVRAFAAEVADGAVIVDSDRGARRDGRVALVIEVRDLTLLERMIWALERLSPSAPASLFGHALGGSVLALALSGAG